MCKSPVTPVRDQGMFRPPIRSLDWIHVFVLRISLVSHAQENESLPRCAARPPNPISPLMFNIHVSIICCMYFLNSRFSIRVPSALTDLALNPNVRVSGKPSIVIATAVVAVDHNGNDAGGGGGGPLRLGGGERSPPPVSLLLRHRCGGRPVFRAGARRGALCAPQGLSRGPQLRRHAGRLVVLHFGLVLPRRRREELRPLLPLAPRAGGLERALLLVARLVPRGLAEFGTFSGEEDVRVPPGGLGRLHFKSVVVVKLEGAKKWTGR